MKIPSSADPRGLRVEARRAFRTAGFVAVTFAMLPVYVLRDRTVVGAARDALRDRWLRRWSDALLALFAVHVDLEGSIAPSPRGRLIVANHRSTIDVAILLRTFGGHMVSRGDIGAWPLLGAAARSVGTVFVDRASAVSGATAIREIRTLLKEGGTVCIFPEGTTFADDEVHPFHSGAFVAVLKSGAEVVPVGIAYPRRSGAAFVGESFGRHLGRMAAADPSRVAVKVGAPIAVPSNARAGDLRDRARHAVRALVADARARADAG